MECNKTVLRGKFIAKKKKKEEEEEKHQIDNLTSHLKQLGKEGHLKKSRRKEILQIRSEINEKEMQEQ